MSQLKILEELDQNHHFLMRKLRSREKRDYLRLQGKFEAQPGPEVSSYQSSYMATFISHRMFRQASALSGSGLRPVHTVPKEEIVIHLGYLRQMKT